MLDEGNRIAFLYKGINVLKQLKKVKAKGKYLFKTQDFSTSRASIFWKRYTAKCL